MNARRGGVLLVRQRMAWLLIALAPAVLVQASANGGAWLAPAVAAIAIALTLEVVAGALRGVALRPLLAEMSAAVTGLVVLLCLPGDASLISLALGISVAVLLGKHAFGGFGEHAFNPAMLGVAVVALMRPDAVSSVMPSFWLPLAYLLGGVVLLARGVIGWQAPIGVLAGTAIAAAFVVPFEALPESLATLFVSSPVLLGAFFVATDPVSGCAHLRARVLFGLGAGLLIFLIDRGRSGLGLPFAILLMNFAAPWLDQFVAPARPGVAR